MAKLEKAYGDALFESALEGQGISKLYEDVQATEKVMRDNPELMDILRHPDISIEEKQDVVKRVFESWTSPEVFGFLILLIQKERIGYIFKILQYVTERYKEYMKIGVVYVTSALEISETQRKALEKKVLETTGFSSLEMHYDLDASLIGGVVIRIGDRVVDGSVKMRLSNMTRQLKNIQIK